MTEDAVAAVVGHPVAHSLSPRIFDLLCRLTKKRIWYISADVKPDNLKTALSSMHRAGFIGLNVTLPHKEAVIKYLDVLSPQARAIGAVNVIRFVGNKSFGYNSDAAAFLDTLDEKRVRLKNRSAAVLGAGGASKALCYGLSRAGVRKIYIINRNVRRAVLLVKRLEACFPETKFFARQWNRNIRTENMQATIWVNATPVGMEGFHDRGILLPESCGDCIACDLVYRPLETPFLRQARERGMKIISGLEMLIYQALRTWKIWSGHSLENKSLKKKIEKQLLGEKKWRSGI